MSFKEHFKELFSGMVQVAFEYVDRNVEEVDTVYVYVDMEDGGSFFNVFYKINGQLIEMHKVNEVSTQKYDVSLNRMDQVLIIGLDDTEKMRKLFEKDERKVPTQMKMVFEPKTGKFDNAISYDLFHSNKKDIDSIHIFKDWFYSLKNE